MDARGDLFNCDYRFLLPAIKLHEPRTHEPWKYISCPGVVIKLEELLSADGRYTSTMFDKIRKKGGLHNFLDFEGMVILSTVMPDYAIFGLTPELYAWMINEIEPDYYLTPDGQNYFDRPNTSEYEIRRILRETDILLKAGLSSEPIGLVKGCCAKEATAHCRSLIDRGIEHHVMHVGDCIHRATKAEQEKMLSIYHHVAAQSPWLLIYGVGSRKYFRAFPSCNGFVTQSHYTYQFRKGEKDSPENRIMENLREEEETLLGIESNRTLDGWQMRIDVW